MLERMSNLNQRLLVGILVLSLIVTAIYFSSYPYFRSFFVLIAASIIGGAVWEFYQMAKSRGVHPLEGVGVIGSVVYVIAVFWSTQSSGAVVLPFVTLGVILFLGFLHFFFRTGRPLSDLSITWFGIIYLTVPLAFFVDINYYFPPGSVFDGRWWLVFLILISKTTDTGGFFIGKIWGRRKLAPLISPQKTWEGAIGGSVLATAAAAVYYLASEYFVPVDEAPLELTLPMAVGLAFVLSIFAQIGDLSESILKRDTGIKDSNQLPGLGGILDVVDSLVFTTPIVYIYLKIMYP